MIHRNSFKHLWSLLLMGVFSFSALAQKDSIESIMMRGIAYADQEKYDLSLLEYQKAFNIEPKNGWVNYEMALSHYYMGNKTRAEKFAKSAMKERSENGLQAIVLLGAIYDERGEHSSSIKIYRKGLKTYGDYYLLWYNLGVTANTMKDFSLAEEAFSNAVKNKLDHASSHYALSSIMMQQNRRPEALLPLYFFLLIEANSDRSSQAFTDIARQWERGVVIKNIDDKESIELQVTNPKGQGVWDKADLELSKLEAKRLRQGGAKAFTYSEFSGASAAFFNYLAKLDFAGDQSLFSGYYLRLFQAISQEGYMEPFCQYIAQSAYEESATWVDQNTDNLSAFFDWLDQLDLETEE